MDENKYFSKERQQKAIKWLEDKWKDKLCECCKTNNWTAAEDLVAPITFDGKGGFVIGGPSYPQVMVMCTNCGNTKYFNAIIAKLISSEEKEEEIE